VDTTDPIHPFNVLLRCGIYTASRHKLLEFWALGLKWYSVSRSCRSEYHKSGRTRQAMIPLAMAITG
jgi:hypothetical protein